MRKRKLRYRIGQDGFIESPEVADAKLLELNLRDSSLALTVEALAPGSGHLYELSCSGIVVMRIDRLTELNLSLDFFASADETSGVGLLNDDLMNSLFEHEGYKSSISRDQARQQIADRELFLFGNEPSCGCEIALICKKFAIYQVKPKGSE